MMATNLFFEMGEVGLLWFSFIYIAAISNWRGIRAFTLRQPHTRSKVDRIENSLNSKSCFQLATVRSVCLFSLQNPNFASAVAVL